MLQPEQGPGLSGHGLPTEEEESPGFRQCQKEPSRATQLLSCQPNQMVRALQLGNCETEVASRGLVGRTLMGKSQLKVSTSICSTPVQLAASDGSLGVTGASATSR